MLKDVGSPALGEILIKQGRISREQLDKALEIQGKDRRPLGEILLGMNLVKEETVKEALSVQLNLPFVRLSEYLVDPAVMSVIPEDTARRLKVLPLFQVESTLTLAMADPGDLRVIDELRFRTGCEVNPVIATDSDILRAIDQHYGPVAPSSSPSPRAPHSPAKAKPRFPSQGSSAVSTSSAGPAVTPEAEGVEAAPVVKLVNQLLTQAIQDRASDIHLEPTERALRVRYRIDGLLQDESPVPREYQAATLSRLKIMASLDIAERRLPQDGRFRVVMEGRPVDFRVSTFPTIYGEKIVLRILDKSSMVMKLEDLGFRPETLARYRSVIRRPHGILLVTGPTGSGKTSTIYATLLEIHTPERNIVTLEDPVEYELAGINQGQTQARIGFTFAQGLRSILRQDPDVIFVGEIRDLETAQVAIQAALTGHLVFSTLHTNDAPGAVTRLTDMGVEPFLVASSVVGVLGQRLVRRLCSHCREPYAPNPEELLGWEPSPANLYRGSGCGECRQTGYRGRVGLYEFMIPDEEIQRLIIRRASTSEIRLAAVRSGMESMVEDGRAKALSGLTAYDEVCRVAVES
jgi:type IV pilus assembly protein PilB